MKRRSRTMHWIAAATACTASVPALEATAAEPTAQVIEYYNASIGHYFITAFPEEAAMLDQGIVVPGWTRTGVTWNAWTSAADSATAVPVCRFFGTPNVGPNSHFYTSDPAECAKVKQNPDWTFEAIAFYIEPTASATCAGKTEPIYRSFFPGAQVSESNHRFLPDLTMFQKMAPASILEGVVMCSPLSSAQIGNDAVRLLEQSTFGPTDALVAHAIAVGPQAFVAEQFAASGSFYTSKKYVPAGGAAIFCPADPDPTCVRDYYSLFQLQTDFFRNALTNSDQLRQRVAFALSQIFVTSGLDINEAYGMATYQQIFLDNAFGNFEDLLTKVTLSSVMGDYLNMVNNDKPVVGVNPNENYARELLQLFAIGLWELNPDGTQMLDASGKPIPSYDQPTVEGFAHVFTGWTYPLIPGTTQKTHNPKNFLGDMAAVASNHDTSSKLLLNGFVEPAGLTMDADLDGALHNVFMHPNTGPFIVKQLIQKLVTGDPSPQYVARVAAVFNDNGSGMRGDLRAVINAILLDAEARGDVKFDPGYGKLREPVLFMAAAARAVGTQSDGVYFSGTGGPLGQDLFYSPSVFNYYPSDHVLPETANVAPEFAIQNSSTYINRSNVVNTLAFGNIVPLATYPGATGTHPNWSTLQALAGNPNALCDKLDGLLLHGTMSATMRAAITSAVNAVVASDTLTRATTAYYLVVTSADYQVER